MSFAGVEPSDSRTGYGTIGQLRQNSGDFDPYRRRSSSQDNSHYTGSSVASHFSYQPEIASQKFGALPTLGSHTHQQKMIANFMDAPKPRHTRSVSQPGPPGSAEHHPQQQYLPLDSRMYDGSAYNDSTYNRGNSKSSGGASRSASLSHHHYDQQYSGSGSMPNLSYHGSGGYSTTSSSAPTGYPTLERRESLDYHTSPVGSHKSSGSYMDGLMTSGSFVGGSPPTQGPHPSFYGTHTHVRQQSDNVVLMQSSQSMYMGPSNSGLRHHNIDDDGAHPLMGENIDVPEFEDQHGLPSYLMQGGSGLSSHPLLRGATHSHSMSLDAIPPQYMDHSRMPQQSPSQHKVVYAVKFKRSQRNFVLGPRITRDLKIGTYVKVEADRGEDLGIVVGKPPIEKFNAFSGRASFTAGMGPPPAGSPADLKRIMRLATHDEVSLLALKRDEEEELLKICRAKVRQRGLPMNVVDAEYQFDRHKLTFFFEAMGRVDFRELVRDLFSMYKTRIWMQQLDKNTSTSAQAIIAPQTANLQMDYGTPIIAPPSEFADSIIFHGMSSADDSNRSH
jgi:PSP1 C-terminal conserved region